MVSNVALFYVTLATVVVLRYASTDQESFLDYHRPAKMDIFEKLISVMRDHRRRCRHGRNKRLDRYIQRYAASNLQSSKTTMFVTRANRLKKDWCRTEPLRQKITEKGCISKTIANKFCYGQCNSFYIPQSSNRTAFQSCPFCKPHVKHWTTVTLKCPSRIPTLLRVKVLLVRKCRCTTETIT